MLPLFPSPSTSTSTPARVPTPNARGSVTLAAEGRVTQRFFSGRRVDLSDRPTDGGRTDCMRYFLSSFFTVTRRPSLHSLDSLGSRRTAEGRKKGLFLKSEGRTGPSPSWRPRLRLRGVFSAIDNKGQTRRTVSQVVLKGRRRRTQYPVPDRWVLGPPVGPPPPYLLL